MTRMHIREWQRRSRLNIAKLVKRAPRKVLVKYKLACYRYVQCNAAGCKKWYWRMNRLGARSPLGGYTPASYNYYCCRSHQLTTERLLRNARQRRWNAKKRAKLKSRSRRR